MTTITMEKHILKRLDALEDFAKEIRAALAAPATAPAQPAWHDAPNAPGDWVIEGKGFKSELQKGISQQEIDRVSSWPGRWYGPIPEDKP